MIQTDTLECTSESNVHMKTNQKRDLPTSADKAKATKATSIKGFFIVMNDKGLHTRPSTELVKCATSFKCQINLIYQDIVVNAKSLLGILTLAAARGARIEMEATGEDAELAIATLIELARNKFYIHF